MIMYSQKGVITVKDRIGLVRKKINLPQREFAERLNLTRNFVSLLENGDRVPSDRTIMDICREFDVNEHWLRTGEGQMFNELTREEELTRFFAKTLRNPESKTMRALIYTLAQLPDEALDAWADFAIQFYETLQKEKSGQPPDSD